MIVSPSILSADWARLADAVRVAESADWLHCDVMDGHFVPNLTFGPAMIEALSRMTKRPLDVHLMIDDPLDSLAAYAKAGAWLVTVHVEAPGVAGPGWVRDARPHAIDAGMLRRTLETVRAAGVKAGLALRPDTSFEEIESVLDVFDVLLVMTVYPGFSGQSFLEGPLATIERAAKARAARGLDYLIEIDGGVALGDTAERVVNAGADALVAGHGIYRQDDPVAAIRGLKALVRA